MRNNKGEHVPSTPFSQSLIRSNEMRWSGCEFVDELYQRHSYYSGCILERHPRSGKSNAAVIMRTSCLSFSVCNFALGDTIKWVMRAHASNVDGTLANEMASSECKVRSTHLGMPVVPVRPSRNSRCGHLPLDLIEKNHLERVLSVARILCP